MHIPFTLWTNSLLLQMICITDLYDCVNFHTVIILYFLFTFVCVFDMFHILLSVDSLGDLWNVCMYVCMYVKVNSMTQKNVGTVGFNKIQ